MSMSEAGYLLRGGRVVDGSGETDAVADVAIRGERIEAIGRGLRSVGLHEIDVSGRIVCPGFVDMHSHSDAEILRSPSAEAKVFQGVTHDVVGQDGMGYVPRRHDGLPEVAAALRNWNGEPPGTLEEITSVRGYLDDVTGRVATNISVLAPHGALRLMVMDDPTQPATTRELNSMLSILRDALEQGAVGMSGGLAYYPGQFADSEELIALCEVVAQLDGYFAPHHRNYGPRAFESYREMLEIAKRSGVRLHLTHANLSFPVNKGRAGELVDLIDEYERGGSQITLDTYPYDSGATSLAELLPSDLKRGGSAALLERLRTIAEESRFRERMEVDGSDSFHGVPIEWSRIRLSGLRHPALKQYIGLTVAEASRRAGVSAARFVIDALIACDLDVGIITHYGNLENMERLLVDPRHCLCTDGLLAGDSPHPRAYGSFSRYLSHYVRDTRRVGLAEGIRKVTSLPASILRLNDRGQLKEGYFADVTVLDFDRVTDTSSFENPRTPALGVDHLFINGVPVIWKREHTDRTPGRGLAPRRSGFILR